MIALGLTFAFHFQEIEKASVLVGKNYKIMMLTSGVLVLYFAFNVYSSFLTARLEVLSRVALQRYFPNNLQTSAFHKANKIKWDFDINCMWSRTHICRPVWRAIFTCNF